MRVRVCALAAAVGVAPCVSAQVRLTSVRLGAADEFQAPTFITQPPGETRRLYITEKTGTIEIWKDGARLPTPLLTGLPGLQSSGECGLLGLAFHPDFQANGYMYILYQSTAAPAGTRIERYTLDPSNPEVADPATAHGILTIDRPPISNHQGGWIGFGPDGFLYISSGDGGSSTSAQMLTSHRGKILRIDVNGDDFPADAERNYAVPASNPYAGSPTALAEIWAMGLRNPWRCSFDRGTGDFWIGDVGAGSMEEVNHQPAATAPPFTARNYGWPAMEGTNCSGFPCFDPAFTLPVYEYGHGYGNSVICGYVYRGSAIPAFRGMFIVGDLSGRKWSFRLGAPAQMEFAVRTAELGGTSLYAFGEDSAGEVYYCTPGSGVFKILPACAPNCDGSTAAPILNVADFTCFLQAFAAGDGYANCDGSTSEPALNVADFTCFLQTFAAGCP